MLGEGNPPQNDMNDMTSFFFALSFSMREIAEQWSIPHTLPSLGHLRSVLRDISARITHEGTPKKLGPFVIGLTGYQLLHTLTKITET